MLATGMEHFYKDDGRKLKQGNLGVARYVDINFDSVCGGAKHIVRCSQSKLLEVVARNATANDDPITDRLNPQRPNPSASSLDDSTFDRLRTCGRRHPAA